MSLLAIAKAAAERAPRAAVESLDPETIARLRDVFCDLDYDERQRLETERAAGDVLARLTLDALKEIPTTNTKGGDNAGE